MFNVPWITLVRFRIAPSKDSGPRRSFGHFDSKESMLGCSIQTVNILKSVTIQICFFVALTNQTLIEVARYGTSWIWKCWRFVTTHSGIRLLFGDCGLYTRAFVSESLLRQHLDRGYRCQLPLMDPVSKKAVIYVQIFRKYLSSHRIWGRCQERRFLATIVDRYGFNCWFVVAKLWWASDIV